MKTTQQRFRMPIQTILTLAAIIAGISSAQESHAAVITIPTANVTASSEIPGPFNRQDDFIVDGSGLAAGQHTAAVEPNMWLSTGTAFGGDDLDPWVQFDLGAVYTINSFQVWNYNESPPNLTARGVNSVAVDFGTTAALGSTVAGITNFAQASGLNTYAGETFNTFTPFNARFIKFDINSNHGGDNNFYGLSEVQFDGVLAPAATPEPSTAVLAVLALAGLTFGYRRRRGARALVAMLAVAGCTSVSVDTATAAPIAGVTIEDFSSELNLQFNRLAVRSIDGSGLSGGMHDNNASNMWEAQGTLEVPNDTAPWHITYDLEANYSLNDIHVWNYNEAAANLFQLGAKDVEIHISPTDNVAGLVKLDNAGGDFVFAQANGLNTYAGFSVDTSNVTNSALLDNARLVRFNILSAHTDNNGLTGLAEVRFDGGAPITGGGNATPEPASAMLLALGLVLGIATGGRRRRR